MAKIVLFILLFAAVHKKSSTDISGTVTQVHDGNTLEIITPEKEIYVVVLEGIDCPELTQPYGDQSKTYVESIALHKEVSLRIHGKDRLKNYIAVVMVGGDRDIRIDLLREGLAWSSEKDPLPELETLRLKAVGQKKGLWIQELPIPPWMYRRQQSMSQPKSR
jgi:endonuclease YncB( thermonuclease family)